MEIIKCPKCGHEMANEADQCIKCGYALNQIATGMEDKPKKKKIWFIAIPILVILIVLFIWFILVKTVFLKPNILMSTVEAGENIKIKKIVEPAYRFADLKNKNSVVDTQKLGKISVPYTLSCFGLSTERMLEVEVVDTKNPIINGPDSLIVTDISSIDWAKEYSVDDFSPNLEEKISLVGKLSVAQGVYDLTLKVEDESGNIGQKQIKVEVLQATQDEKNAINFINVLVENKGYKKEDITKLKIFTTDNDAYFFEVNGFDTYFYNPDTNSIYTFDEAALLAGQYRQRLGYKLMLETLYKDIDMTRIDKIMKYT